MTRITDVETIELRVPQSDDLKQAGTNWTCLVRVTTDAGISGIAEVISPPSVIRAIIDAPTVLTRARGLRSLLVGEDPSDISRLWRRMYEFTHWHGRRGAVIHAIGAVDMALWDLRGRLEGLGIADLLGARRRERVKAYATIFPSGSTPDEVRRILDRMLARHFRAFKICAEPFWRTDPERAAELVRAARAHLGPDLDLIIEGIWIWEQAEEILPLTPVFRECRIAWLESPLRLDDIGGYARLHGHGVRVSAGDAGLTTRYEYGPMLDQGLVDIAQPDIAIAGGYTELLEIDRLVRNAGRRLIPHGYKTYVTDAANLAFLAQHWADEPLEYCADDSLLRSRLICEPIEVGTDGTVAVPNGPGLGVTLDEEIVARYRVSD